MVTAQWVCFYLILGKVYNKFTKMPKIMFSRGKKAWDFDAVVLLYRVSYILSDLICRFVQVLFDIPYLLCLYHFFLEFLRT